MNGFWKSLNSGSLTQVFVTALWDIDDPELRAQRNRCLALFSVAAFILFVGIIIAFSRPGALLFCLSLSLVPWTMASNLAEEIEEQLLKQKTPDSKLEDGDSSTT